MKPPKISPGRSAPRLWADDPWAPSPSDRLPNVDRDRRIALLVDFPSLMRGVRAVSPEAVPDLEALVERARSICSIYTARAYGAWYDADEALAAFSAGVDPVFVPPAGPALVPSAAALIVDGLSLLHSGQVDALALAGDDRLLPLIAAAQTRGLQIALLGHTCRTGGPCLRLASEAEPAATYAHLPTRAEKYRRGAVPGRRSA